MATTGPQGLDILVPSGYQPNQGNVDIDIIAVPGLGADPSKSFGSETPRGFNWLTDEREGIRSDIPKSRVCTSNLSCLHPISAVWGARGSNFAPELLLQQDIIG